MRSRVAGVVALAAVGSMTLAVGADARGGPSGNLGNGLGRLLAPPAAKGGIRLDQSVLAIRDKQGRVLVDVYAADGSALATVRARSEAEGLQVTDQSAEHKILEGFVAVSDVKAGAAFPHDLDPSHSEASNGGLTITANGPQGDERRRNATDETVGSMTDPQFFRAAYSGPGSIVSLTLDGAGADPTGLGKRPLGPSAGLVFDPRPFLAIPALGGPTCSSRASRSRSARRARGSTRPPSARSSRGRASSGPTAGSSR